ncbi:hypothetical protein J2S19_000367 [Metabacillus malikii]|uniref:Uncharacterized protein n=1 Tax=Metabacillus malikii TaxID=1504265 RepID=A0ABT9ZBB6_9BACI|nr:hypothetical protein [Metabacillus malikii]
METTTELVNRTKDIMLQKGIYYRPPTIQPPDRSN